MYREIGAQVIAIDYEDEQIQQLKTDRGARRAILYKAFTKSVKVGDKVMINVTATDLDLGTGGWDIVRTTMKPDELNESSSNGQGHIMKARYTPIQHSVVSVEAEESEYHSLFLEPFSLGGRRVLLAELHSMVPLFYYVARKLQPGARCCVIFDDQASLPLAISKQLRELHNHKHFTSITAGQAFGGQYEAVTVASALQCAVEVVKADIIMISVGPGIVGTGTTYGFSGLAAANWSHIVSGLGGMPVWIPRLSFAEKRKRHYGLSHHTLTALGQFTFQKAILPIPFMDEKKTKYIRRQLAAQPFQVEHHISFAEKDLVRECLEEIITELNEPIKTMGREYGDDPLFFLAVAEAVRIALILD